jgi:hypothetical protein
MAVMSRKSRAYACLIFWGDKFSPQEFSFAIDLQATRIGLTGEKGDYNACYKRVTIA